MSQPTKAQLQLQINQLERKIKSNSTLVRRATIAKGLGKSFKGQRDLYQVLGYPLDPQYEDFFNIYDRDGMGTRIVDAVSDETWREKPVLIEGENKKKDELDNPGKLQQEFSEMADRLDLYSVFNDADAYCGISRYSLILLGLPGKMSEPAQAGMQIAYVTVHDEGSSQILEGDIVKNSEDKRFGLANYYNIAVGQDGTDVRRVHHSRVIHIKEGRSKSRIYGTARLRSMYNRLQDLEKVVGGGSEAFWLLIHRGMAFTADEGVSLPEKGSDAYNDMKDEIEEYEHGLRRFMRLVGLQVQDLGGKPVDSDAQFKTLISYLSGSSHIPQRILVGSEAGQLASSQDDYNFYSYISSRQTRFAEPKILRAFIFKCSELRILKAPPKYTVRWPSLFQLTDVEKANIASTVAGAINTASNGAPETMMNPKDYAKRYLDYVPEEIDPVSVLQPSEVAGMLHDPLEALRPETKVSDPYGALRTTITDPLAALRPAQPTYDLETARRVLSAKNNTISVWLNENDNSAMIAFKIPENLRDELQKRFPFMDQETKDNLHITIVYLGDVRSLDIVEVYGAIQDLCSNVSPIKTNLQGLARFVSGGDKDPIVCTFDSPSLPDVASTAKICLTEHGVPFHDEHGFIPHMTIAYIDRDGPMPVQTIEPLEINFDKIYLVNGGAWIDFPMGEEFGTTQMEDDIFLQNVHEPTVTGEEADKQREKFKKDDLD